ncbi:hypothetical protein AMELA_G00082310 [Ameiurus melas]|uniref:Uncharacterized protein n=1 Tax=Ameiurus melas TaxID=219545 RepID=A0A7J6B0C4_AMEME|nr:hypothetical protein AMELA_G00082310 [Ameiurus melas]
MRRNHKETPQHQAMLGLRSSKMDRKREGVMTFAPESSNRPTNQDFGQQTAQPEEVLAHGENSMHSMAKQNIHVISINKSRNKLVYPVKILDGERAGSGPAAKSPGKPKLLPRMPRMDPIGHPPFRALMRKEKLSETYGNPQAHGENSMCTTAKQNIRLPVTNTTRKKSVEPRKTIEVFGQAGVGPAAKSPGKPKLLPRKPRMDPIGQPPFRALMLREKLSKTSGNPQVLTGTTEVKSKSFEATIEVEPQLRTNIIDAVLDCITSGSFKNQLRLRIVGEIDDILAKAVSQVHEQQHPVIFGAAGDKINNISWEQQSQSSNNVFMPGFSDGVASMIGCALIELREGVKKTFTSQSHEFQTASPTACDSTTEIVESLFESMLDSLIPQLKPDVSTEKDPGAIGSLYSYEFDTVSDSILPSTDSDVNQSPVHEPRGGADEESSITAEDIETLDIVKERANSPRRSTKVPFSTVFDLSSGPEVKAKDEIQGILAASGSMSHLDDPLTSRVKSDSDLDASVLEVTPTSSTEYVDHMSRSDEVAEEGLVAKYDVELEQIMAAPSEEHTPSDITSQSLEMIGHQECASPVPSPPSSDKPTSPRGSARRRACSVKVSSLPNIFSDKGDGIFVQSHQKLDSGDKCRLSLTGMEMGSSGSRSSLDEPLSSSEASDVEEAAAKSAGN